MEPVYTEPERKKYSDHRDVRITKVTHVYNYQGNPLSRKEHGTMGNVRLRQGS